MEILAFILILILCILLGIAIDRLWIHYERKELREAVNPLPAQLPATLSENEKNLLALYMKEWEIIIQTQMHFNDLILRFRSTLLAAFVTLVGAVIAIQRLMDLEIQEFILILCLPVALWMAAFFIDFAYYHRMLLGSVAQALKFDNSAMCRSYGLFGMSTCIKEHVHPPTSKVLVIIFYVMPFIAGALVIALALVYGLIG